MLTTPVRGFHVVSHARAPRALRVLDAMMVHLALRYSAGGLTAARLHGAMVADGVVHVRVEKARRAIELCGERVEFFQVGALRTEIREQHGGLWVSGVHAVLWELVAQASQRGGLERVVPLIRELAPRADPMELTLSAAGVPLTCVARLGFILERVGQPLRGGVAQAVGEGVLQHPRCASTRTAMFEGREDERWQLFVNVDW